MGGLTGGSRTGRGVTLLPPFPRDYYMSSQFLRKFCRSPFTDEVELMRVKVFHLECLFLTVSLSDRIPVFRFVSVHLEFLVVLDSHLLEHVVDLVSRGDVTVVQNPVEIRK